MSRRASALEGLDDDHAPTAARARMRERLRFGVASAAGIAGFEVCCRRVEQLTRLRDVVGASAVREEAVVADGMKTARPGGGQGGAGELVRGQRQLPGPRAPAGWGNPPPLGPDCGG